MPDQFGWDSTGQPTTGEALAQGVVFQGFQGLAAHTLAAKLEADGLASVNLVEQLQAHLLLLLCWYCP